MGKIVKKRPAKKKPVATRRTKKVATRKKHSSVPTLTKFIENPIISPSFRNGWEAWQTFNPGVILLNDQAHFLYRAIGEDCISRLGYAVSKDGLTINERLSYPVYEHRSENSYPNFYSFASGGSFGGCEDARLTRVDEEDDLYMTYTACDEGLRVALTSIKISDFLKRRWKWTSPKLISAPGEVHKNWVLFPEKINGQYAILHSINPEILINYVDDLEFENGKFIDSHYGGGETQKNCWDSWVRGAGPPPIKTEAGWLLLYHAVDGSDPGKYKVGAMLLDLNDPTKILHRAQKPILEPDVCYENCGFKGGIVYASGAIVKDGNLFVYYGGADNYVCVAYAPLNEFLKALQDERTPKLRQKILNKSQ